jgi:2-polyprenyl-3-methyl-5-hydroxy-6-metoxy-1,4-benzoquinol methylase
MSIYAEPRHVDDPSTCVFYHALDLPGLGTMKGNWDMRGRFEDYTGNVPLAGKRFLDIGTASGFLSFEAERRGAEVVSFDSANRGFHHHVPFPEVRRNPTGYFDTSLFPDDFDGLRNAYWLAHRLLKSRAKCYYGNVYDLPEALGEFDVVMVGQILGHLRDPLGALTSIAARCRGTLIVSESMIPSDQPVAYFPCHAKMPVSIYRQVVWWQLSPVLVRNFLQILGLEAVAFHTHKYSYGDWQDGSLEMPVNTMVAVRTEPVVS